MPYSFQTDPTREWQQQYLVAKSHIFAIRDEISNINSISRAENNLHSLAIFRVLEIFYNGIYYLLQL